MEKNISAGHNIVNNFIGNNNIFLYYIENKVYPKSFWRNAQSGRCGTGASVTGVCLIAIIEKQIYDA